MSEISQLIKSRRTIQDYKSVPIPEALLNEALELATFAPNHKLTQPWRFLRLGPQTRIKLAVLSAELKAKKNNATASATDTQKSVEKFLRPAEMLIAYRHKNPDFIRDHEDYASMACAIQNMQLFLWSHNIGTKWGTGALVNGSATYELLDLDASLYTVDGLLWIGFFSNHPVAAGRKKVEEILSERP